MGWWGGGVTQERRGDWKDRTRKTIMGGFLWRNSRLPLDGGGAGVSLGLAGEQHVGSTHVPVVVVANYSHLRGIWLGRKKKG